MRRAVIVPLVVLALVSGSISWAGLLDKVKEAGKTVGDTAKEVGKDAADALAKGEGSYSSTAAEQSKGEEGSALPEGAAGRKSEYPGVRKDESRKYAPGLSFSSLLNGVKMLPKDGRMQLHHIQATFLPEDGREGFIIVRTKDGKGLYRFDWKCQELEKPYFLLDTWKITNLETGENPPAWADMGQEGDYVLDFYTNAEHFYTFPFGVKKVGGDDPFGDGEAWQIGGDWGDWAYFYYTDADPSKPLVWKVWLRSDGPANQDVKPRMEVHGPGGNLICVSRDITLGLKPDWVRYELDTIFPPEGTSGGAYFKAKDLLESEGDHTLTLKLGDTTRGVWKFAIKDGKFVLSGRADRAEANPLTFVEGGRDAFWYKREESGS